MTFPPFWSSGLETTKESGLSYADMQTTASGEKMSIDVKDQESVKMEWSVCN
jgi:hypothetical protein